MWGEEEKVLPSGETSRALTQDEEAPEGSARSHQPLDACGGNHALPRQTAARLLWPVAVSIGCAGRSSITQPGDSSFG